MVWTFIVPPLILKKLPNIVYIIFDVLAIIGYIYIFVLQFGNNGWFENIAVPIVIVVSILVLILINIYDYYKPPIIIMAISTISAVGVFCVATEFILNLALKNKIYILWSAIVIVCCFMIIIPLVIIIKRPKLREEVRRRMHI